MRNPLSRQQERSLERAALAEAIGHRVAIERQLAGIESALGIAQQAIFTAAAAVTAASEAVETAKQNSTVYLTATALGTAGTAPQTVKAARAGLRDAEDTLDAAREARAALKDQQAEMTSNLDFATRSAKARAQDVLIAECPIHRLTAEYLNLARECESRRRALEYVDQGRTLHVDLQGEMPTWRVHPAAWTDLPGGMPWETWLDALNRNPDAVMPP